MILRTLVAIDDLSLRRRVRRCLPADDVLRIPFKKTEDMWVQLANQTIDFVILTDAGPSSINETVSALAKLPGSPGVVVVLAKSNDALVAELLAAGALAVTTVSVTDDALRVMFASLVDRKRDELRLLNESETVQRSDLAHYTTSSLEMEQLITLARRVAHSDSTILVLGETGVGKEWLARAVHGESSRSKGPFIAVNCAAIPEGLVESEFFGHREGAFTGARHDHRGRFELAHGGTIFLDEIAETPLHLQAKLLRVLQERAFVRVGGESLIEVDVRVIAATNRDPRIEIEAGRLRDDLFYRLSVVTLGVPPLRRRREDLPGLTKRFFDEFNGRLGKDLLSVDDAVLEAFQSYEWPGNVRELINVMERAVLLATGETVSVRDIPTSVTGLQLNLPDFADTADGRLRPIREGRRHAIDAFERAYLIALLTETRGRVGIAAERAGLSPRALFTKLKHLDIDRRAFSEPL